MTRRFCFSSLLMLVLGFFTSLSLSHAQTAVDGAIGGTVLDAPIQSASVPCKTSGFSSTANQPLGFQQE